MIVITGPGRSGTSFLAKVYRELGFDPGGWWQAEVSAGFEHKDVWALNQTLQRELGVSAGERRGGKALAAATTALRASDGHVPPGIRAPFVRALEAVRYHRSKPDLIHWNLIEQVARGYGEQMRTLARERAVAKDPQFCFTMAAWLAAGAEVEAIVLMVRPLDAMVDSRVRAGMYGPRAADWAKNNYPYGIGLLLAAATEYRVPVSVLRYPDFLEDPEGTYGSLSFPEARTREEFLEAFSKVRDPSLVHDRR